MPFYPPHVATSKTIFNEYETNKCTFYAQYNGNIRFFITSDDTLGYTEIENYNNGETKQITLSSAGSAWKWRAILEKDSVITNIYIHPGEFSRIKEIKIHENYYDIVAPTTFNVTGSYQSALISTDIQIANLNYVTLSVSGSNLLNITGSITNNGTDYFPIDIGKNEYNIGSEFYINPVFYKLPTIGNNIKYKLEDTTGSAYISLVNIEYKSDDYV